ncbi:MAG: class I SAM-dependent DNA methyltransferase [Lachnospiraceae bacterium]|nr:class I SAM-dependent DNA methyltransferase [Lachnospiraceae bacterium]
MTDAERKEAARQFVNKWQGKGNEDQDSQLYWIEFLSGIVGMENVTDRVKFEKKVIVDGHSKKIDVYIPETHTLIEQKSLGKALDKKITNSGDVELTPYEQAKRYNDNLPYEEKARWIITSNFAEIWIYDMNAAVPEPLKVNLIELQSKYHIFDFLADREQKKISVEMEVSVKAGGFVGLLYDALLKEYLDPANEDSLKSLNMLCVRLVFCLYAEDARIFGTSGHMFHDYMAEFPTKDMRKALIELFKILDTPVDKRDRYDTSDLMKFPYVNGGLFAKEDIEIPNFTEGIRTILLDKASEGFDWSDISPTIFGAVFESTLNPETRRSGGMHYTSIENIHKVIDPLFLNDLKAELDEIKMIQVDRSRNAKLRAFQDKLASLKWLDPACGSGNFLTETYISVRRLENEVISLLKKGQMELIDDENNNPIKVQISQFYGIEINDFAVTVAKSALWIAESQMMKETEEILLNTSLDFLPLKTNANIVEGNALRIDWESVVPKSELNYIMGNPPFVGARLMSPEQKDDVISIFGKNWKNVGNLDYVTCWYKKATDFMLGNIIRTALVSTNSVSQGETVANLWKPLFDSGCHIDFAHRTFRWDSESNSKAHVHCVIIGFSTQFSSYQKVIYTNDGSLIAKNINGYLLDADDIFVESRNKPICDIPEIGIGNMPIDGGNYLFTKEEKEEFIKNEPSSKEWFHLWYGSQEFINRKPRYCLYLAECSPNILRNMKECMKRVEAVRLFRDESSRLSTKKLANTPLLFGTTNIPNSNYIIVPKVSSERRRYIPIGFMTPDIFCSDLVFIIPNATLFHFGILTSNVHMAWVRTVCGRLKSDYRYSKDVVYNNFPWPTPTDEQKATIEETAQGILDARAKYPDSSLADLYDPLTMPPELLKAHQNNDRAVMKAYGFNISRMSEADCVAELMKMYKTLSIQ